MDIKFPSKRDKTLNEQFRHQNLSLPGKEIVRFYLADI
jgi:hypothetical protein